MKTELQKCMSNGDDADLVTIGSVIVETGSNGRLSVEVHLDDGKPNAVLSIGTWLDSLFDAFFNILTINGKGKGNAQVTVSIPDDSSDSVKVEVWVFDDPFSEFYFTPSSPMELPLKK